MPEAGRHRGQRSPGTQQLQRDRRRNMRSENRTDKQSNTNNEPPSQPLSSRPQIEDQERQLGTLPQSGPPGFPAGADTEVHIYIQIYKYLIKLCSERVRRWWSMSVFGFVHCIISCFASVQKQSLHVDFVCDVCIPI